MTSPQMRGQLTTDLEQRVLSSAQPIIQKAATEEVANRALADAIESKLSARIDDRIATFWQGAALGAISVAAAAVLGGGPWTWRNR